MAVRLIAISLGERSSMYTVLCGDVIAEEKELSVSAGTVSLSLSLSAKNGLVRVLRGVVDRKPEGEARFPRGFIGAPILSIGMLLMPLDLRVRPGPADGEEEEEVQRGVLTCN
jgi:hypothetical protein